MDKAEVLSSCKLDAAIPASNSAAVDGGRNLSKPEHIDRLRIMFRDEQRMRVHQLDVTQAWNVDSLGLDFRRAVTEWLFEYTRLRSTACYTAQSIVDRCVLRKPVDRAGVKLLLLAAVSIAAKLEDWGRFKMVSPRPQLVFTSTP